ncbi:MAG: hypothetical protein WC708_00510 [Lentisphaeria bacterium]|jgi:Rieske Fe-S protein
MATKKKTEKKTDGKTGEKKVLTPKQAQIKVSSLFRGLDNEVTKIQTGMKTIHGLKSQISNLALGLANVAVTATAAAKAAKTAKPAAAKPAKATAKPVKKAAAKPAKAVAKPAKEPKAAKPAKEPKAAKPATAKAAKPAKAANIEKAPVPNRPTTRDAIKEILTEAGKFLPVIEVRDLIVAKYGYISRQSVYQAAKKDKDVIVIDGKLGLAGFAKPTETAETTETTEDDNAEEALVNKIAQSQATSAMA